MIKILSEAEEYKAKELFKLAYNSTDEFTEYFFKNRAKHNDFIAYEEDGKIISIVLFSIKHFDFDGRDVRVAYIHGAATLPEYRKKGINGKLIETALEEAKNMDCYFAYFFAVGDYEKFNKPGFNEFSRVVEGTFVNEHTDETLFLRPSKPMEEGELAEYSKACLNKSNRIFLKRDESYFFDVIDNLKFSDGNLEKLVDTAGNMMGFCFVKQGYGNVYVTEITSKYGYERQILNLVCDKYNTEEVKVLCDEKSLVYNAPWFDKTTFSQRAVSMVKILNEKEMASVISTDENDNVVINADSIWLMDEIG